MARNANTLGIKEQKHYLDANTPGLYRQRLYGKSRGVWTHGLFYKKEDGQVIGPLVGWGYPIRRNRNWDLSVTALAADILEQTGMENPTPDHILLVELWEGKNDPDDYAALAISGIVTERCAFQSVPALGEVAYIIDAWVSCIGGSFSFIPG